MGKKKKAMLGLLKFSRYSMGNSIRKAMLQVQELRYIFYTSRSCSALRESFYLV